MIAIADVDRLVTDNDAVAARVWPRLGRRVRRAYLGDRNAWLGVRKISEEGTNPAPAVLARHHRVFDGWARAFRAAARGGTRRPRHQTLPSAAAVVAPTVQAQSLVAPTSATTDLAMGTKAAIAGGLLLVGAVALSGRRKRA